MIVFPVWYLVIAGILAFLSLPIWLIALYILLLPVAGLASFKYYIRIKKLKAKFRYTMMRNSPGIINLRNKRKSILDLMHIIIKHQNDPI
jgi:hypothetical protein